MANSSEWDISTRVVPKERDERWRGARAFTCAAPCTQHDAPPAGRNPQANDRVHDLNDGSIQHLDVIRTSYELKARVVKMLCFPRDRNLRNAAIPRVSFHRGVMRRRRNCHRCAGSSACLGWASRTSCTADR